MIHWPYGAVDGALQDAQVCERVRLGALTRALRPAGLEEVDDAGHEMLNPGSLKIDLGCVDE